MIAMNSEMSKAYRQLSLSDIELDSALNEISESGFKRKGGCSFLSKCLDIDTNTSINDFPDQTGYECFINSINIDDYIDSDYLEQGVCFVRKVFSEWNTLNKNYKLIAILMLDEFGLKVKFHMHRTGEQWLSDELEDYEESILIVDSMEVSFN